MQWLARISVRRAVFASVLMLAVVVVGVAAYGTLRVDFFPNVDRPLVTIITRVPGAAPEEVEKEVSQKIEAALNTLEGLDELSSQSSEGVSFVLARFDMDKRIDVATQEVRDSIQRILFDLPQGIDPPQVSKLDPNTFPVLFVAVRGSKQSLRELTELSDKRIRRALESTPGVGQVQLIGGHKRQINVLLDLGRLRAHDLSALDVQRALGKQNLSMPGGTVQTGPRDVSLRVQGRVQTVDELERIVVRQTGDRPVRVGDVANVEDGEEDTKTYSSVDGQPTLVLGIQKQSGQNTVAVVDAVLERLAPLQASLPAGVTLEVIRDMSASIRTQVNNVREHLIIGALFAAAVVLLFLGSVRSTLIAALAIPISILGTFALMWAQGFTLNLITLLALALSVGIVIDDAVVVLENIVRFVQEKELKPFPAAIVATKEIGLAVLATTLSLMAVFLPIAFMSGFVGRLLRGFGLTLAFAIGVSLLVSFTLTPMLAARWLTPAGKATRKPVLERMVDWLYRPIERGYMVALRFAMRRRWVVVVASVVALASCVPLFRVVKKGFLPANDEANFMITVRAPEGTSLASTSLIAERVARETRRLPGVSHTMVTIGGTSQLIPNLAQVYVKLVDPRDRRESQLELAERARREVVSRQPKELRIEVSDVGVVDLGASMKTVGYFVTGPDSAQLARIATDIVDKVERAPGATDVDSDLLLGKPELRLEVLRDKAADLGVQVSDVAASVQLVAGGLKATTYEEGGETYDVRVRAAPADRASAERLDLLTVPSSRLGNVPLGYVVRQASANVPAQINRMNRQRQVTIGANVRPGFGASDVQAAFEKAIAEERLPSGYRVSPGLLTKEAGRAARAFLVAFALSFIFMYLVLAAQFESWLHPLTILICLPLTLPFALASLVLLDQALSIMSALGLLVLFGVVKKNSILQVDHTNSLRTQGMPRDQAILVANRHRLRPILMTTIAFVAGMIPLLTARGIGAGYSQAIAGVVVGGQVLSLLLTLLATPVFYSLFDDAGDWMRRTFRRGREIDRGQTELDDLEPSYVQSA